MNKPSKDRFFATRASCYSLKVSGQGVKPVRDKKVVIAMIDFKNVSYVEEGTEEGFTILGMIDGLLEVKLNYITVRNAYMRYKKSL